MEEDVVVQMFLRMAAVAEKFPRMEMAAETNPLMDETRLRVVEINHLKKVVEISLRDEILRVASGKNLLLARGIVEVSAQVAQRRPAYHDLALYPRNDSLRFLVYQGVRTFRVCPDVVLILQMRAASHLVCREIDQVFRGNPAYRQAGYRTVPESQNPVLNQEIHLVVLENYPLAQNF